MVLILVVMEDGLVHTVIKTVHARGLVLILVVMEDGLVHISQKGWRDLFLGVLILVVMEDGLVPGCIERQSHRYQMS